jgi:geranylgeranyl pyrophosphate synthase
LCIRYTIYSLKKLGALQSEATALGYAVLIAEGAEAAAGMLREGLVDAVIGVSCLPALEETFARIADEALPAMAVPLLRDGCDATDVDVEMLLEHIRLTRPATAASSLSVDAVQASVQTWFEPEALRSLLGTESSHALEIARTWLAGPGKRWRPLLTASVYYALRDSAAEVAPKLIQTVAVAAECFHKASLIHDDIEDNDDFRNGAPTLHQEHGVPIALNAGDLLIGVGYRLLATCVADESARLRMLTAAAMAHCGLCVGQGDELQWRGRSDVPASADLIHMFSRKTAPAFEVAILLGAIAGGADAETCAALADFSRAMGIAYQIGDDQQDVEQDSAGDRAWGLQPSMMLALLCDRCTAAERQAIQNALSEAPRAGHTRLLTQSLFEQYQVAAAAEALREDYRDRALQALAPIRVVRLKSLLTRLVKRILPRTERGTDVRDSSRA